MADQRKRLVAIVDIMSSNNSGGGGSDFHNSIYKLLNMTLACRPSNPIEQLVQHELAHAIHQVPYFEDNKPKFREQLCTIFFNEVEKIEDTLPSTDCIPLPSLVKVIKALYGENLNVLSVILENFSPGQYLNYTEFEDIVDFTVTCLNFSTYLKTFICDAINKSPPSTGPQSNVLSFQFLQHTFQCLIDKESPSPLPNTAQWKYRATSVLYALDFFEKRIAQAEQAGAEGNCIKVEEFLRECVSNYFGFISGARDDMRAAAAASLEAN